MGFSVQVPVHRAVERDPQAVERWMREVWPEVEKAVREQDAWLVFEDEAGQSLRPAKGRTWSRRRHTPVVKVTDRGSGRVSLTGLVCIRPGGPRARLIYRMLVHSGRNGEKKGFYEDDYGALLGAAHQQLGDKIVLIWDNATQHKDTAMRRLLEARSTWLTVFRLPPYTPDLNTAKGAWAHLKEPGRPGGLHHPPTRGQGPHPPEEDAVPPRPPQRLHPRDRPDLHRALTSPRTAILQL
jgi:putative transposase